ncbi:MAG: hypothetical protein RIN55_05940 [Tissierellaceae bacterium]|nr:hypothetical protein [Tissierellaceae bacterium]
MDIVKDILYVNKQAGVKTLESFKNNWIIIFTGFVYTVLNILIYGILGSLLSGPLYILSGIIAAIISAAMVSNYLYLLFNIINYNRITLQDFKNGFGYFLRKIYVVIFIGYIATRLLSLVSSVMGNISAILIPLLYLSALIVLNPLPETIYLKYHNPWESIVETADFMKENWLNWGIPNIIFLLLLYIVTGNGLFNLFNTHISYNFIFNIRSIVVYIIGQIIFSVMMIYRGHLYKLLSGSTRRKRMFMNKF